MGVLEANPFKSVLFDLKVRPKPYAVPTDEEVSLMLGAGDPLHPVLLTCLLSGMRAGEAVGLQREDLVGKGNLGTFVWIRPNELRLLKTDAAERLVPVHPVLECLFRELPSAGPLFPEVTVAHVTKGFSVLRRRLNLERPGLVFHSTRKWFVTQCERTGVPEHFTASLVGHQSARSENGLTYGIYSAGISDEQKRSIVDQIRLPA
jgi:integrase